MASNAVAAKSRAAAEVQVTAEQLVRAAREHQSEDEKRLEKLKVSTRITDEEEVRLHQAEKRREFESKLRHTMVNSGAYVRYAKWEESQLEFRRARSIFERALEGDNRDPGLWIKYAELEMRNHFVNHARNILDRAVQHLPRANQCWYKYVQMEETLGQIEMCRRVFDRWMRWHPEDQAWYSYVNFEMRQGEVDNARDVYERYCGSNPRCKSYIRYAKWEENNRQLLLARQIYERVLNELDKSEAMKEEFFIEFARFEERCKEIARARAIYKEALALLPEDRTRELYKSFVCFERQNGDKDSIENVLMEKRRAQYEERLKTESTNYDIWFDYIRLTEAQATAEASSAREYLAISSNDVSSIQDTERILHDKRYASTALCEARDRVRDLYNRAVQCFPPDKKQKAFWRRYIYLWINFAIFEEVQCENIPEARQVYARCLQVIPHKNFTFSKIWIMAANFEIRQKNLSAARLIFGQSIGICPHEKVYKAYLQLELQLGNIDRCRTLYGKFLELAPQNTYIWQKYAALEASVGEIARARSIYELAISQASLDMPEALWKQFIDFEASLGNETGKRNARQLYKKLLERSDHVKIWISFAKFEIFVCNALEAGRTMLKNVYEKLKDQQHSGHHERSEMEIKENRALLLISWLEIERKIHASSNGENKNDLDKLKSMQPETVTRRREMENGEKEYYVDYVFKDDPQQGSKLLELAKKWKMKKDANDQPSDRLDANSQDINMTTVDENEIDVDDV